jgi:hypothetical protein
MNMVSVVKVSRSRKLGQVAATYAPIHSCPSDCPLLNRGCYAQHDKCGILLQKLNKTAEEMKKTRPIDIAKEEAKLIKELPGDRPLRLHVVGDAKTSITAEILADAVKTYPEKVWTYTHAWKTVPRDRWGRISVLASCETLEDCNKAMDRGYAACILRLKPFEGEFFNKDYKFKMVSCKSKLGKVTCNTCKICMDDYTLLNHREVICFFPHGPGASDAELAVRFEDKYSRKL